MFRVDQSSRIELPGAAQDPELTLHEMVEIVGDTPVWLVQVGVPHGGIGPGRRRFATRDLERALEVLDSPDWRGADLYLMQLDAAPPGPPMRMGWCRAVWECREPDGQHVCWRVETERGVLLDSLHGTALGLERVIRRRWQAADWSVSRRGAARFD